MENARRLACALAEIEDVTDKLDALADPKKDWGEIDEELIRKVLVPYKIIRSYCRVAVEGLDNLPVGRGVVAANHTGWLGLDYTNLALTVHGATGRVVRGVVHEAWFKNARIGDFARRIGLVPASRELMVRLLKDGKLVVIFPEGEHGAFKEVTEETKYQLYEFRRGFVRAAMEARAPIVPVAIVGGEEANPSLGTLALTDKLFRIPLPRPRNVLPKPVKWRISILKPVPMARYRAKDAANTPLVHKIAADIQGLIQDEIEVQLRKRGNKYW